MMDAERWRQLDELFQQAVELTADQRRDFLDSCDEDLRREVLAMLDADDADRSEDLLAGIVQAEAEADAETTTCAPLPFDSLGPYQLREKIGEGGLSTVYAAERNDHQFSMRVAIKLVRVGFESQELLARLRLERQILARLEHPNIARLIDGGTAPDGRPYFVMELIEGERIDHWCDRHELDSKQRLEIFLHLCDAVQSAHRRLVLHRDIKPSNILVTDGGVPKLLDFGIAKLLDTTALDSSPQAFPTLTAPGDRPLTPEFASPEQIRGEDLATASDVYSLGVLLYQLLTGQPPYQLDRRRPAEIERVICTHQPERPSAVVWNRRRDPSDKWHRRLGWPRGPAGDDLDIIVLEALRKEPDRRYGSVSRLASDIRCYLEDLPVSARADTLHYRASKFVRRHRLPVAATAALVLALSAGAVTTSWLAKVARQAQRVAEVQRNRAEEQQQLAERDRRRAEQAKSFLVELFRSTDPYRIAGQPVSVRDILDSGAEQARTSLGDDPLLKAELLSTIGQVYRNQSLFAESEELLTEALRLRRRELGADAGDILDSRRQLALLWLDEERFSEAESALEEVVAARRAEADSDALATALFDLAFAKRHGSDIRGAELLLDEALELRTALQDELGIAEIDFARGQGHRRQGDFTAAEASFRKVLEVRQRHLTSSDPRVLETLNALAITLQQGGDLPTAEKLFREILDERRRIFDEPHHHIITALHNLARTMLDQGKTAVTLEMCDELDRQVRLLYGEEHPAMARTLYLRSLAHRLAGRLEEAEVHARRAWRIDGDHFGVDHESTLRDASLIAELLAARRDPRAESFLERLISDLRRVLPSGDYLLSHPLQRLGTLAMRRGDLEAAETALRESLEIRRRTLPAGHWEVAAGAGQLGRCLGRQRRFDEAKALLNSSLAALRQGFGDDHPQTLAVARYLAELEERLESEGR